MTTRSSIQESSNCLTKSMNLEEQSPTVAQRTATRTPTTEDDDASSPPPIMTSADIFRSVIDEEAAAKANYLQLPSMLNKAQAELNTSTSLNLTASQPCIPKK
eukprot:Protomagalhaensia_wolfi_Nauph_80__1401@NODE_183_length_3259_cov_1110_229503_g138_i0_p9_GENE_NODE_183_length_3259_cov_1110_229503_g138_i0NODE_183_length_3259_cov_1110_229503_g138_i0_p9_ORF_typecomplete_len103_score13_87_NODE_183_length_3259_cov_1110_229503_g138_i029293237